MLESSAIQDENFKPQWTENIWCEDKDYEEYVPKAAIHMEEAEDQSDQTYEGCQSPD